MYLYKYNKTLEMYYMCSYNLVYIKCNKTLEWVKIEC